MTVHTDADRTATALDVLTRRIDRTRIAVEGPELDAVSAVWNGAVTHRPALVVRCATAADVRHAIRAARASGLPLSVRGGGHDWAGRAVRPGGLVIDLTRMRHVSVHDGVATVAGGATSSDVAEAADRHGLTAVTGTVGAVGMIGLTLGGGYGPLLGSRGLAADNLLAAEVVLADGRIVRAAQDGADPELLWALRGGGGNFGVVTSAEVALHPVAQVLAGSFTFPWDQAGQVLRGYGNLLDRAPDALGAMITLTPGPDGDPIIAVSPTWSGALRDGTAVLDGFARLGTPLTTIVKPMSPLAKLREFDGAFPDGARYEIRTRNVAALTDATVSALLGAFAARTAPGSFINIHHFHGAATRTAVASGAFGLRRDHFMVELIETGAPEESPLPSGWPRRAGAALAPHALPGGYPNLLGPDDVDQADAAYGPNSARLLAVKARLDPDGVFTATPLPRGPQHPGPARKARHDR
ncbi:FAD-dependent oxidoreductase [Pseudonocardia spinosispora]|uniref:FAD-dependent oxidoreductase n=1 Tax=Pseudonocardia spinosispora TaxID=103441 RepID=UPI0012EBD5F7|nr:FAD-binding oxidoreductase [Pseudonocardia spinosispora]